ncbi:uncharacterized protein LOC118738309 [Rhagoletis pomonella]|uniref:uncharacterized protein LOC118738309 n=1 Tax=Rhagoletis pomonella TaxID=28610 RepID=UPI00178487C1|nr:uncharacterized protein LOC118738309 [Rhagoletis pomonella]
MPQTKLPSCNTKFFRNLILADRHYDQPGPIEVLLGVDVVFQVFIDGQITHPSQTLVAKNTLFGWVIAPAIDCPTDISVMQASVADLDSLVRSFWEQESLIDGKVSRESAESLIEGHFRQHYTVSDDGRYMASLPFNPNVSLLGQTRNIAMRRLLAMERRFMLDAHFKAQYIDFMCEYERLGHMTRIQFMDSDSESYFLPHHAVLKPSSTSTKLRVVLDASAKPPTGYSLNDCLLTGPVIQNDLFTILVQKRKCIDKSW